MVTYSNAHQPSGFRQRLWCEKCHEHWITYCNFIPKSLLLWAREERWGYFILLTLDILSKFNIWEAVFLGWPKFKILNCWHFQVKNIVKQTSQQNNVLVALLYFFIIFRLAQIITIKNYLTVIKSNSKWNNCRGLCLFNEFQTKNEKETKRLIRGCGLNPLCMGKFCSVQDQVPPIHGPYIG